jgi:hypothetical protein
VFHVKPHVTALVSLWMKHGPGLDGSTRVCLVAHDYPILPEFTSWPTFPFEGDFRVRAIDPPAAEEPPRQGEDPATCAACLTPDSSYLWVSARWRVRSLDRPTGLPIVLILESRSHLDLGDLPNLLAAELGVMTVRLERAVRSLDGVARVHVNRWGDGSAHLHLWFLARPFGQLQLRGTFLSLWDDILPPVPETQWQENLAYVGAWLAEFGGRSMVEPPRIDWQSPSSIEGPEDDVDAPTDDKGPYSSPGIPEPDFADPAQSAGSYLQAASDEPAGESEAPAPAMVAESDRSVTDWPVVADPNIPAEAAVAATVQVGSVGSGPYEAAETDAPGVGGGGQNSAPDESPETASSKPAKATKASAKAATPRKAAGPRKAAAPRTSAKKAAAAAHPEGMQELDAAVPVAVVAADGSAAGAPATTPESRGDKSATPAPAADGEIASQAGTRTTARTATSVEATTAQSAPGAVNVALARVAGPSTAVADGPAGATPSGEVTADREAVDGVQTSGNTAAEPDAHVGAAEATGSRAASIPSADSDTRSSAHVAGSGPDAATSAVGGPGAKQSDDVDDAAGTQAPVEA